MKHPLAIIISAQFGYNPATFYYCKYLRNIYDITCICWDHGLPRMMLEQVKVVYVNRAGGPLRIFRLLAAISCHVRGRETILFLKYFKGVSTILRFWYWPNPFVLDIRTGSVDPRSYRRFCQDLLLRIETLWFPHVTVISKSLAKRLHLDHRATILPLGAEILSDTDKDFTVMRLLYVGTLFNRHIDRMLEGFISFCRKQKLADRARLTIIGTGKNNELDMLQNIVRQHGVEKSVSLLGQIPHDELGKYFNSHNVGISYIPMTSYYDVQPATKTFEYLLSGLAVIGTATSENKLVISETNGVLTGESPEEFADGLVLLLKKMDSFDSQQIRNTAMQYSWRRITDNLDGYIQKTVLSSV